MDFLTRMQEYSINKSNVYIIPSKNGHRFVAINFFLFIMAITYANNLALLISFFMVSYFVIQMFMVHKTILDLDLKKVFIKNQYAKIPNQVKAKFNSTGPIDSFKRLELSLRDQNNNWSHANYSSTHSNDEIYFKLTIDERKKIRTSTVRLSTRGVNDLFFVWRYFKVSEIFYIYPEKNHSKAHKAIKESNSNDQMQEKEFEFHIRHTQGMPAKRIDWKKFASSNQLFSKKFSNNHSLIREIHYSKLEGSKEERLSKMSYLITESMRQNYSYKVILPNKTIPQGIGREHFVRSMELISEY